MFEGRNASRHVMVHLYLYMTCHEASNNAKSNFCGVLMGKLANDDLHRKYNKTCVLGHLFFSDTFF
jgi:hypothetical protein